MLHAVLNNDAGGARQARPAAGHRRARRVVARQEVPHGALPPRRRHRPRLRHPRRLRRAPSRRLHPGRADSARLPGRRDARRRAPSQREFLADDAKFAAMARCRRTRPPITTGRPRRDRRRTLSSAWTTAELDRAFAAPAGDPVARRAGVGAAVRADVLLRARCQRRRAGVHPVGERARR